MVGGQYIVKDLIKALDQIYCSNIGVEFNHLQEIEEKKWLYGKLENSHEFFSLNEKNKKDVLRDLVEIENFENYLHTKFQGAKRFSIEGGESSIVSLKTIIEFFVSSGAQEALLGMAHRGRLNNSLTKIMKKPYHEVMAEFIENSFNNSLNIAGDVKYHMGYSSEYSTEKGKKIHLSLLFNPSHLEAINPVLAGRVRAKQDMLNSSDKNKIVGILIHGDAAFCGQGVVAESLAMRGLDGYDVGGIIHIVINNQVGFTANSWDVHASRYATEFAKIAKIANAPIIHVNGDDIEAVIMVTELACHYKQKFKKDVVLDIVCYRKYGHNEGDEPMFTQGPMYNVIHKKPSIANIYAKTLLQKGIIEDEEYPAIQKEFKEFLDSEYDKSKSYKINIQAFDVLWKDYNNRAGTELVDTFIPKGLIEELTRKICSYPSDFSINLKIAKLLKKREDMVLSTGQIDWAGAEQLAFASILLNNIPIRLSGEDCGRATFGHRNSVLHSQTGYDKYLPLNNIADDQAKYEVYDSLLSEYGVLGFEYGYSITNPKKLTIWEAQYGDFVNTAQVIIDQFIVSSETKWLRMTGLVILLPHGYDGQGPEHSSARIERFLQLAADNNMVIVNPSNPASYFHILRQQALSKLRRPLIVFTPKQMLRHKLFISDVMDIAEGSSFHKVIDDKIVEKAKVKKLIIYSGKVYYDLVMNKTNNIDIALIRVEQLYPFPISELEEILKQYSNIEEIIWCQEEHKNMGAWSFASPILKNIIEKIWLNLELLYVGRKESSSPAAGYSALHKIELEEFINKALKI
jgi:2-oxoglutarate dehydrogenase E1 component